MAIQIPIWPGSSSFSETPFGFFDSDSIFQDHADKVATWCATRLGYPLTDVELQAIHFYACFEEAVLEYSNQVNQFAIRDNMFQLQGANGTGINLTGKPITPSLSRLISVSKNYGSEAGSGGYIKYKTASLDVIEGQQIYDLENFVYEGVSDTAHSVEIKKIFHDYPPAITRYFDPFVGTGLGSQQLLENFGWGSYSPGVSFLMMPVYADLLRLQAIEFNDQIRKSAFSFAMSGTRLKLFPIPTYNYKLFVEYITIDERDRALFSATGSGIIGDFSNAPYQLHVYKDINPAGKQWIFKYTLALAKEVLGNIRNKYSAIPIPGAEVTLNGADLIAQAQAEKDALVAQIRENLEATSRSTQMTKLTEEADNMQSQLNKIPLTIYIG